MERIRKSGPVGVMRPFQPQLSMGVSQLTNEQMQLEALEHIAAALSAIDHNIEVLTKAVARISDQALQKR